MVALSESLIRETYKKLKEKAARYLDKGNIQKGLLYTHLAANTNYAFWLSYFDEEIENLIKKAGETICKREYGCAEIIRGRCVMLDSLALYRGGLTVQYVKAILSAGWKFLYITGQEMQSPRHIELYNFLVQEGVQIQEVPKKLKGCKRLQFIYDSILNFSAERVYLHCITSEVFFTAVCYSLPLSIQKYFIDMADHSFRTGINSCDYSFEFRDLGCSIAAQYMHYPREKMLMLPFYPVIDNVDFKGIPTECEGKVIILSGGIFWKIVDNEDTYFRLCQKLLLQNPNAIILYPGDGDPSYVTSKLKEYGIADRFLLLGWRNDINELFRQSDIFLNTYPHGGATMSQYAAHSRKPILSYRPIGYCVNPVENFVCHLNQTDVSSVGEDAFLEEAHRLINDSNYRKAKAERVYSCVMGSEMFNKYFKEMSKGHHNILPFSVDKSVEILHERLEKKIKYHNETGDYQTRLVSIAGLNMITLHTYFIIPFVKNIIPKLWRVITTRGFHFNRI